jgi:cysteine desulfurase
VCADLVTTRELVAGRARDLYARVCAPGTLIVPTAGVEVGADRLPGMVSVLTQGVESETTVLKLDALGYEVSAGSACSSGSLDPSHVLTAMGIPRDLAFGSLRVSFDERVEPAQLAAFGDALVRLVAEERC